MQYRQMLIDESKWNIKCPYKMEPEYITVHNTANDASAENEVKYMISNNNEISFHYAVDDKEAVQGILTNRNSWNAGDGINGTGNRKSISVEICYSKSGGDRFIRAEKNAAIVVADLLKGWDLGLDRVRKHQDWNGKYCPHRTLDMGWERFMDMVKLAYNGSNSNENGSSNTNTPTVQKNIEQVAYDVINGKYGNNPERRQKLEAEGYDYNKVQTKVNEILDGQNSMTKKLAVGSKVKINSSASTYATGEKIPNIYKNKTYTVQQLHKNGDKVLIKELYSWVFIKDITVL